MENALANADARRDARAVPSRAVASNARPRALSRSALGRRASTHQQESGDVFHPCCEVVLKCVRVFVAEEFDSCLSLQRADDSRAHKRRTARGRPARSSPRGGPPCSRVRLFIRVHTHTDVCAPFSCRKDHLEYTSRCMFYIGHSIHVKVSITPSTIPYDVVHATRARSGAVDPRRRRRQFVARPRPRAGRWRWRVGFIAPCTANPW